MNLQNHEKTSVQIIDQACEPIPCPVCGHDLTVEKTEFFETHICENCFEYAKVDAIDDNNGPCCGKPNYIPVGYVIANEAIQVRTQCTRCFEMTGKSLGGYTKEQREALPKANIERRDKRREYMSTQRNRIFNLRLAGHASLLENKSTIWWQNYKAYLNSDIWRSKRRPILERDNYLCQSCLKNKAEQIHHTTYRFVDFQGNEPAFDLTSLCSDCHDRLHELMKELKKQGK